MVVSIASSMVAMIIDKPKVVCSKQCVWKSFEWMMNKELSLLCLVQHRIISLSDNKTITYK